MKSLSDEKEILLRFWHNRKPAAFTLIELLIVVAIVSILAAIAVPNFMNAMTRSKISRAASDIRSLRNALEMYRMEKTEYPAAAVQAGLHAYNFAGRMRILTSPTPYIASLPNDPFPKRSRYELNTDADLRQTAEGAYTYGYFRSDSAGPFGNYNFGKGNWMLSSSGPDGYIQYLGYFPKDKTQAEQLCSLCRIDVPAIDLVAEVYDSSNGLVSSGEIIRWSHDG